MKPIQKIAGMILMLALMTHAFSASAQQPELQYFRAPGLEGANQFETPLTTDVPFEGVKVRVGGDFAIQMQGLTHSNDSANLTNLGTDFNLPTANLNIDVQLHDGVRLNMVTYLSSRHHAEAWVKGGYMQMDKLDFIQEDFLEGLMKMATFRIGYDEINYGDAHFRRTDNARAIYNPFVGNYIMDAFTTEPFFEFYLRSNGLLGMIGLTNGKLNQSVQISEDTDNKPTIYGKLGYDSQVNEDFRLRLTGSVLVSSGYDNGGYTYGGDRAGARYYSVMVQDGASDNFTSGRFNPRFSKHTAFQINPFVKFKGLEFFGIYEMVSGDKADAEGMTGGSYSQIGAELLFRFGTREQFYIGGRYNMVSGEDTEDAATKTMDRMNFGGGWYMTDNVQAKLEYVQQNYTGDGFEGDPTYDGGEFGGFVLEAVIGF